MTPKQPPPYHIAAAYSKNAHLFAQLCPPSPHDQPKQFSQEQPSNIHHPTPKMAKNHDFCMQNGPNLLLREINELTKNNHVKWPFGHHPICKVVEVELKGSKILGDFYIVLRNDVSIFLVTKL